MNYAKHNKIDLQHFYFIKQLLKKYYSNNKEILQQKAHERYQSFSKVEKEKKQQYGRERYKNLAEDKKQKLVEYRKKYCKMRKNNTLL